MRLIKFLTKSMTLKTIKSIIVVNKRVIIRSTKMNFN